jgi:hypothetical protein
MTFFWTELVVPLSPAYYIFLIMLPVLITSVGIFGRRIYERANVILDGVASICLWSVVELGVGLSAGSAAALTPLLRWIWTRSWTHSRSS